MSFVPVVVEKKRQSGKGREIEGEREVEDRNKTCKVVAT
jgi:hypothetical protein